MTETNHNLYKKAAMRELCECHGHLMMDGTDYRDARKRHAEHVDIPFVRGELDALRSAGVSYFRDGGDALMVSAAVRDIPAEYGIEYVTPVFAIHKAGLYGAIVGRSFRDLDEYSERLLEVRACGGDFIKLIVSGILTFREYGELSCPSLTAEEIREMIRIAHNAGYPVMIHVNGNDATAACIDAGADSIEHAYFQNEETLNLLAGSETVWVPTLAPIEAFIGRAGFNETVVRETLRLQMDAVRRAQAFGAHIACGSDSGAVGVPHGNGTLRERELLLLAGVSEDAISEGNARIRKKFRKRKD